MMCTKADRNEMSPEDIPFSNLPTPKVVLSYETENDNDKTGNDGASEGPCPPQLTLLPTGKSTKDPSTAVNAAANRKVDEGPLRPS